MRELRELHSPYPGLRPFASDELSIFFGREAHTSRLIEILHRERFLAVVGPSGAGKSSLVRAGLLPALALGWPGEVSDWRVAELRPGERPMRRLAEALLQPDVLGRELGALDADAGDAADAAADLAVHRAHQAALLEAELRSGPDALAGLVADAQRQRPGQPPFNLLVLVDQFEELFRYADLGERQGQESDGFIEQLLASARATQGDARRVHVVLTMRTDALHDCARFLDLPEAINRGQYLVPRLKADELRRAITEPARVFDGTVDTEVVDALLGHARTAPDQLPLLQHALAQMWRTASVRDARQPTITADDARAAGGLEQALSKHAEALYAGLPTDDDRALADLLLRAITGPGDGGRLDSRRPQRLDQITRFAGLPPEEWRRFGPVLRAFAAEGANFLHFAEPLTADTVVDISHEALIRGWDRLRALVEWEAALAAQYRRWRDRSEHHWRTGGERLRGADLQAALRWRSGHADLEPGVGRMAEGTSVLRPFPPHAGWAERYALTRSPDSTALEFGALLGFIDASEHEASERAAEAAKAAEAAEAAERERRLAKQSARRKQLFLVVALAVGVLLAVAGFAFAYWHSTQAAIAKASELAATSEALTKDSPDLGLLLALESRRYMPTPKGDALLRAAATSYPVDRVLRAHDGAILDVWPALNNRRLVTAGVDGTARVWDGINGEQPLLLRGHQAAVVSVQTSPDSGRILTASRDATARLWDAVTGEERCVFRGHEHSLFNARFSLDGRAILTASEDATARIWDASTCVASHVMRGHEAAVTDALFSADGTKVVTTSWDKTARLWEAGSGKHLRTLFGHDGAVHAASISSDGKTVATASADKTARLWDTESGDSLRVLRGHEGPVTSVEFSPDGSKVLTASLDRTARLWDAATGTELQALSGHGERVSHAHFSSDGSTILTSSADGTVRLWDGATGVESAVLRGHEGAVTSARFTADGQSILSTGVDGSARLWGRKAGGEARRVNWEDGAISGVRMSSDDRLALLGNVNGSVRVIDMRTGTTRQTFTGHVGSVARVAVSPDGRLAISASWDRTARIWDLAVGRQVFELLGHKDDVLDVQFSPDGAKALSASRDGTACLWDVASGKKLLVLSGHGGEVTSVQFSADGKSALTASSDSKARLWDLTNGALLKVLERPEGVVHLARFFPDGKAAFTAGADGKVAVWDLTTGKQRFEFLGHRGPIVSARLSADGGRALTASWDSTARLWDTTSGRELQAMRGHAGAIHGALFSSDGSMALTFGADKTARLWDLPTGKELWVLRGHDGDVIDANFSADGRTIVTVGTDRTVRFWSCAACQPIDELAPGLAARVGRNLSAGERQRFGLTPTSPQSR